MQDVAEFEGCGLAPNFNSVRDGVPGGIAKQNRGPEAAGLAGLRLHSPERGGGGFDGFWSGVRWVHRRERAMLFQTPQLAQQYLAKNIRDM